MFQSSSDRLACIRCHEMNYFVDEGGYNRANYIWLGALYVVSLLPLLIGLGWVAAFLLGHAEVLWGWAPIGAALLTGGMIRVSYKIFVWKFHKVQGDSFVLKMDFG